MPRRLSPWVLLLGFLLVSCGPPAPDSAPRTQALGKSTRPAAVPSADPTASASPPSAPLANYLGTVLDQNGQPAPNVLVTATLIGNNGGGIVSNNGSGLISDKGSSYKLLDAGLSATTDAAGHFSLTLPAQPVNLEADGSATEKAIAFAVASDAADVQLKLAPPGEITGKVDASKAPTVTDFTGVQVFVPGTSYQALTAADGSYTITGVPVGKFALYATKQGLGTATAAGVAVRSQQSTQAPDLDLSIVAPAITSLTPDNAGPGATVTIKGSGFGASTGAVFSVSLGGAVASAPTRTDDGTISFVLPDSATTGDVSLNVGGIQSNARRLVVLKHLQLLAGCRDLPVTAHQPYAVVATDTSGATVATPTVQWSSDAPTVLTVDASGTADALAAGSANLSAKSGSLSASLAVKTHAAQVVVSTLTGKQAGAPNLYWPGGLAFDKAGNLYVSNDVTGDVERVAPSGLDTPVASGTALGTDPGGIAVDPQGTLYVVGTTQNDVCTISPAGQVALLAGGTLGAKDDQGAAAQFNAPTGIARDANGNLFVSDTGNDAIRKITPAGAVSTFVGASAGLASPMGLAFGPDGTLYVADTGNHRLAAISAAGSVTTFASSDGLDPNGFLGVAVDASGRIYAVGKDYNINGQPVNINVYAFSSAGVGTVLAGGAQMARVDGTTDVARFNYIGGIACDAAGNVYVGDYDDFAYDSAIRKIFVLP